MVYKRISKYILPLCIVLGGVYLSQAYDPALTSRHLIWATFALVLIRPSVNKPLLCCVGLLFMASAYSGISAVNKDEWLYAFLKIGLVLSFLFVEVEKKLILRTMVLLGLFYLIYGWWEMAGTPITECKGVMCNKNPWSTAHYMILPFCYELLKDKRWKYLAGFVGIGLIVNIVILTTRSTVLGTVIFLVVLLILNRKTRLYAIAIPILTTILLVAKYDTISDMTSMNERFAAWSATLTMIKENPLGVGSGNWWITIFKYGQSLPETFFARSVFRHPHNDHLWILAENGIIGFVGYLGIYVTGFYYAVKSRSKYLVAGLAGFAVISFFSFPWERAFLSMTFVIYLLLATEGHRTYIGRWIKIPLVVILVSFLVVTGFRHKSLERNLRMRSTKDWYVVLKESKPIPFSSLSFTGMPYTWWHGRAYLTLGNEGLARENFQEAIKSSPYNTNILNDLISVNVVLGDIKAARRYNKKLMKL